MNVLAGLPEELLNSLSEHLEAIEMDRKYHEAERKAKLQAFREQKQSDLLSGKKFEIVKIYKSESKIDKLNDFIEFDNHEWALKILEQYRTIAHSLKLHSISLFVDDKLWKKFNIVY